MVTLIEETRTRCGSGPQKMLGINGDQVIGLITVKEIPNGPVFEIFYKKIVPPI